MKLLLATALLLAPSTALADDTWDASLGVGVVATRVADDRQPDPTSGGGAGVTADVAYTPGAHLGVALDLWVVRAEQGECPADASCFNDLAERTRMLTIGPRWTATNGLFAQATVGAAISVEPWGEMENNYSPAAAAVGGWRLTHDGWQVGAELRGSVLAHEETRVTAVGANVTVGHQW